VVFLVFCRSPAPERGDLLGAERIASKACYSDEVAFQNVFSEMIFQPESPFFRRRDLLVDTEKFEDSYS